MVEDHLGTARIVADKSGSLSGIRRHDYLPFGEELSAGVGGRTVQKGYAADDVRQKFTGKERDSETDLDYAEARYYSSSQGRFTTVDPMQASAHAGNPQTWNRYSYVGNNPLRRIDPSGMIAVDDPADDSSPAHKEQRQQQPNPLLPPTIAPLSEQQIQQLAALSAETYLQNLQINQAFQTMRDVLSTNNPCSQLFGPSGIMALEALQSVTNLGEVNVPNTNQPNSAVGISTRVDPSIIQNARTQGEINRPTSMTVNSVGMFFHPRSIPAPGGAIFSNTAEGQAVQIAHEMGHVARRNNSTILAYDGRDIGVFGPSVSNVNTQRIMNACLPAIRTVLTRQITLGPPPAPGR